MTDIKTPLNQSFAYVKMMIENCEHYWGFHVIDLAIECFDRSFPEHKPHRQQLIDLRCDKWNLLFGRNEA